MSQSEARFQRNLRIRTVLLCAALAIMPLMVARKAFDLQVVRAESLKAQAEGQSLRKLALTPQRGAIYDRDGAELAVSVDADSIWANPRQLQKSGVDIRGASKSLAKLLDVDQVGLEKRLASDRFFVWVKRRASAGESKAAQQLKLPGVSVSKDKRRYYPNRELAAHVLGHADVDGRGLSGIELMLDEKLRGARTSAPVVRDGRGNVVYSEHLLDDLASQGHDVTLTINKTLQYFAEHELEIAVRQAEARAGSVVVLDPTRGEILALANYPTFNLNDASHANDAQRRNRAIVDRFEPGSTAKPFTMAGALAAGTVKLTDTIDCSENSLVVDGRAIHEAHRMGNLSPYEVITHSSNIGISKIGGGLGRERLFKVLQGFGFGMLPGTGLPGEVAGLLRPYQRWYAMDAATIPFGQGMSTTPLQLAMSMSAIANKGRLLEPLLVKRVVDARGQTVEEPLPRVRKQVVPERVAKVVSEMLAGVTAEGGTGTEAAIEGYAVAGKTGTAQKSDPEHGGYAANKWVSSFVGFAPANRPRLTIAVVIDEPIVAHLGGAVAAPAFRRIMEASLRHLGVPADKATNNAALFARAAPLPESKQAKPAWPLEAVEAPAPRNVGASETLVPNLLGRPARAALVQARHAMLEVSLTGSGVVSGQQPPAGSVVERGTLLSLALSSPTPELPAPPLASDFAQAAPPPAAADVASQPAAAPARDLKTSIRRGQDG